MGQHTKPIPVKLQRRASALPCDGVKRFKVGKLSELTYSEARAAIFAESTVGDNLLKRGTANRLAELNKVYFRLAYDFVVAKVAELQAEAAKLQAAPEPAPAPVPAPTTPVVEECFPLMAPGDRYAIMCPHYGEHQVGVLSRNKTEFTCVIDGQKARSRNPQGICEKINLALSRYPWVLVKLSPEVKPGSEQKSS